MESNLSCGVTTLLCCFDQCCWAGPSPGFNSRGAKNQKEGPKTRRGAKFFKYSIGCMQQSGGQTRNEGAPISNGRAGHHWPPRWRRPCCWGCIHSPTSTVLVLKYKVTIRLFSTFSNNIGLLQY